ncbi:hypothetical protein L4D76_14715 [Photobacterium sagamiensis]|uniref:hypothetical protein n=1 Tax=Photobacterium sagamiensis TaxID=2910241 RepID=UPI003D0ABEE3
MKFQSKLLSLLIAIAISGCGGSSSSTDSPDSPEVPTTSLSGKVADGYLSGATVCLDLNQNKICDTGEPSATSTEGGVFTLAGVTQAQIDQFPLLVEVVEGQTIDEDNPGVALTEGYTLSAPAGFTFVSPITTMVQNEVEKGSTAADAEKSVQEKLGTTLPLSEDYIAGQKEGSSEDLAEFERLHQVAQVTARVIASNMTKLEDTAANEGIAVDKLVSLIVDEVFEALDEISQEVTKAEADSTVEFNPDSIATNIDSEVVAIDPSTLEEQVKQKEAEKSAAVANLIELMKTDGINWFWGETDSNGAELEYGTLKLSDETVEDQFNEFDFWTGEFVSETVRSTDNISLNVDDETWVLTKSNDWINDNETITSVTANNNSIILHYANGEQFDETVTGTKIDLSGLNIATALKSTDGDDTWSKTIKIDATFPEGAFGYKVSFSQQAIYQFESHDSWCHDSSGTLDQETIKGQLNGICNYIQTPTAQSGTYITTLSALKENELLVGWHGSNEITAKLKSDGTVDFWEVDDLESTPLASGSWSEISAYDEILIKVTAPVPVYTLTDHFNDDGTIYFAEHAGFVRKVWEETSDNDESLIFNAAARDAILDNFSVTPPVKIAIATISVDGAITDWDGVKPTLVDAEGDAGISSMDLTAIYLAQDDTNLYLRLDKASLNKLPIDGAYYNYWVYFESNGEGPEFAVSLFHARDNADPTLYPKPYPKPYPTLWNIKDSGRNPDPTADIIADITSVHTTSQYIEVAVPKLLIDITAKYTLDFFTHYSNIADAWDDNEEEHDNGELLISGVVFK